MTTTDRYTVSRARDGMGNHYATGPLTFYSGNDLNAAMNESIARGGELIDHQTGNAWHQTVGWYDVSDHLAEQAS